MWGASLPWVGESHGRTSLDRILPPSHLFNRSVFKVDYGHAEATHMFGKDPRMYEVRCPGCS